MPIPDILDKIITKKKEMLPRIVKNYNHSYSELIDVTKAKNNIPVSFYNSIAKPGLSIIGEIKKASPSKGIIKEDFNPVEIALAYENNVDAISVLTEEYFFKGNLSYLHDVSKSVNLPLLCKDFIIEPIQIEMAYTLGASAVLLIAAILDKNQLQEYLMYAKNLGMEALVEVHTIEELNKVLETDARIIGINNRNLRSFATNLNTSIFISQMIPSTCLVVSESGIYTGNDINFISSRAKIDGVLVGESFMKSVNIAMHAKELRSGYQNSNQNMRII